MEKKTLIIIAILFFFTIFLILSNPNNDINGPRIEQKKNPINNPTNLCESYPENGIPDLDELEKKKLLDISFTAVEDYFYQREIPLNFSEFEGIGNEVFVLFRVDGRRRGSANYKSSNLAESVYEATIKVLSEDECIGTLKCYGKIRLSELNDLQIELFILDGGVKFSQNEKKTLLMGKIRTYGEKFEPGIHTIRICNQEKQATFLNDVLIQGNMEPKKMVDQLCNKISENNTCLEQKNIELLIYESLHFMRDKETKKIVKLMRGNVVSEKFDIIEVNESLKMMNKWLIENLNDEGYFNYKYFLGNGKYSSENNMIRQLMASRTLAELSSNNDEFNLIHRKNLKYIFNNWYQEDGEYGYILFENKSKLGANAMMLRVLVQSPEFEKYSEEAEKLSNTILKMVKPDNTFRAFYVEPSYQYSEDYLLTFYSGEALLSLAEYYEKTGDEKILNKTLEIQDEYISRYVEEMEENYYPAYVPWHTMSLYKLYKITDNEGYVDAIFKLNDELLKIQQIEKPKYPDTWGRFFNPSLAKYGYPHSSSTGVYLEGLVYAFEIAKTVNDTDRIKTYNESIKLASMNLINMQFDQQNTYYLNHPERVIGGVRAGVTQNYIRVDTTQHASDAFTKLLKIWN